MNATLDAPIPGTDQRIFARTYTPRQPDPNQIDFTKALLAEKMECTPESYAEWLETARDIAAMLASKGAFTIWDIRKRLNLEPPNHEKTWGTPFTSQLVKWGYDIVGWVKSQDPRANGRRVAAWGKTGL